MIKDYLKKILPVPALNVIRSIRRVPKEIDLRLKIKKTQANHKKALEKLKGKQKIKVAFLLINVDTWKYDSLYFAFKKSQRFEPVVIVCPFISKGKPFADAQMEKSVKFCDHQNYNYINTCNSENKFIKKFMSEFDIIFFSNPNKHTTEEFLIKNYLTKLTCYMTYSVRISQYYKYEYDADLLNLVWINFCETQIHKELSIKYAKNCGKNVFVSGYPHLEKFIQNSQQCTQKNKKIIIWAPHWTIKNFQTTGHNWSCFLEYSQSFLDIADRYADEVEFVIKPHPFLESILNKIWGTKKTKEYFQAWVSKNNCRIVKGDYTQLFLESDALIHDSGGFMVEYLMINKPIAYIVNTKEYAKRFNTLGNAALNCHEILATERELDDFVVNVIKNKDKMQNKRKTFLDKHFNYGDILPSEKIVNEIITRIENI